MKNIYDGCLNNCKVLSALSFKDLYKMMDKELENTLNPIVFVDISHSIIASARVVVYKDNIPDIMLNYKHKFIKKNNKWIRENLLGICKHCGEETEIISSDNFCEKCFKFSW